MSAAQHTAAPWALEEVKNDSGHIKHLVPVAAIDGEVLSLLTTVEHNGAIFAAVYSEQDARLIAAAPELLAALQAIVKSLADQDDEGMIEHAEPMICARAAIAKATGQKGGAA